MCFLSVSLETLGLLLRIWLWISVPITVVILLVASYFNYWHNTKPKGGIKLAMEGWGAEMESGAGEPFIRKEDVVGEGTALLGEEAGGSTPRGSVREEEGAGGGERAGIEAGDGQAAESHSGIGK